MAVATGNAQGSGSDMIRQFYNYEIGGHVIIRVDDTEVRITRVDTQDMLNSDSDEAVDVAKIRIPLYSNSRVEIHHETKVHGSVCRTYINVTVESSRTAAMGNQQPKFNLGGMPYRPIPNAKAPDGQ